MGKTHLIMYSARDAKTMGNKGNVVLYLDKNLVEKSKALGAH
jgi:hypothetical protein